MFSSPYHPRPQVLCRWVKAVNADMGQLPTMCSIMNSFSKIPVKTPLMFQELKSSKQLPVEDLSCWNVQNLNENATKQMDNIIESKCFSHWCTSRRGDFHIIIALASLNWYACGNFFIMYDISQDKLVTLDRVQIWRKKFSKPCSPYSDLIQEYAEIHIFFLRQGLWLNW